MRFIYTTPDLSVKSRYKNDCAIGHHFLAWLTGATLSQRYGLTHAKSLVKSYPGELDWNEFLGLDRNHINEKNKTEYILPEDIKIIELPRLSWDVSWDHPEFKKLIGNNYNFDIAYKVAIGQNIAIDWQYYLNNELRKNYDLSRWEDKSTEKYKYSLYRQNYCTREDKINICIHIRRGDINPVDMPERWISNNQYLSLINNVRKFFNDINLNNHCCVEDNNQGDMELLEWSFRPIQFHIISEGTKEDFKDLVADDVKLYLNEHPMTSFHRMVVADILVNSKSAFSVAAAYFHKGAKLCIPWSAYWKDFPDNDNFYDLIPVNNNMDFSQQKLIKALENTDV
jgi:hypothetical protein